MLTNSPSISTLRLIFWGMAY